MITMDNEEWEHDVRFFNRIGNAITFFNKKVEEWEDYWYLVDRETNFASIGSSTMIICEVKTED
jgi:hypothetical protein